MSSAFMTAQFPRGRFRTFHGNCHRETLADSHRHNGLELIIVCIESIRLHRKLSLTLFTI